jgi:DNA transposition AAA+ family ATPase
VTQKLKEMENIQKQNISNCLRRYCERYESQNRAAASLKDVSAATVSQVLNGVWGLIKDDMWRNIASQTGYREDRWAAAETGNYTLIRRLLDDARENSLVMAVTDSAGSGKSFALNDYSESHPRVYLLCCNEYWNRKTFLSELFRTMGVSASGYTVGELMTEAVGRLKKQDSPLLVLDEADKLPDHVLYFFITLYNQLEDQCGIVLCATDYLEKRLKNGMRMNRKGYSEIWSRLGRKCIALKGVSAADITRICELNGIDSRKDIDAVIADSDGDLRRVKRKIHAIRKRRAGV